MGVFKEEKEYCVCVEKKYPALTQSLEYEGKNSHIAMAATHHVVDDNLLSNIQRDALYLNKQAGYSDKQIISTVNTYSNVGEQANELFKLCQDHMVDLVKNNMQELEKQGSIDFKDHRYTNAIDYLNARLSDGQEGRYLSGSIIEHKLKGLISKEQKVQADIKKTAELNIVSEVIEETPHMRIKF